MNALNTSKAKASAPKRKACDGDGTQQPELFKRRISQTDVDRVTDNLIIEHKLPHSLVDSPAFKEAILLGCPSNVTVGCRQTFRKRLKKNYDQMNKNLVAKLKEVKHVATTADGWSKFRRGFLGMTVTWIDPDTMVRKKAALALTRLKGRHTHDRLAKAIKKVNDAFEITHKTTKCTTDSAANFRKAFIEFATVATEAVNDRPDENENSKFFV